MNIHVLPMAPGEYAAEVVEGDETTHHKVLLPERLTGLLEVPDADERVVVEEALRCLLDRTPNTALPHDIDLGRLDEQVVEELRARVSG